MNRYDCAHKVVEFDLSYFDNLHQKRVSPNIVDSLCVDVNTDSDGKIISYCFTSDVSLLFNQQRLENVLGRDGLKHFLDDMASRSSSFSSLRQKIGDDDLVSLCKSRYLQAPSEILSWSDYLNQNYQALLDAVKSSRDAKASAKASADASADSSADSSADASADASSNS